MLMRASEDSPSEMKEEWNARKAGRGVKRGWCNAFDLNKESATILG